MVDSLEGNYQFSKVESELRDVWSKLELFSWKGSRGFVIDTPPPTVSGGLHMGHVFSYCHTDFVARHRRMKGLDVFYSMGYDDNGLPTERLVEKLHKLKSRDLEKADFVKLCAQVSADYRRNFDNFFNRIGLSIDWDQSYHTMDERCRKISQLSFVDLFRKNELEHKLSPVMWDPVDRTALAQAEIEEETQEGVMNYIIFQTADKVSITIATTRPELIPACGAVFFNPKDSRYTHLHEKRAIVPIIGLSVPILPDESVKIDKGSGLVMCCTFGDELDVFWYQKHKLPLKIILDEGGRLINLEENNVPKEVAVKLEGLKVVQARKAILDMLSNDSCLSSQEKIMHNIKYAERSGSPVEIMMKSQWFVKILDKKDILKKQALKCNWSPDAMKNKILSWIDNIKWDWCISRQRSYGVPIPVWYSLKSGEKGKIILPSPEDLPLDPQCVSPKGYHSCEVMPETDVMDTWATSSLTPQINAGGIGEGMVVRSKNSCLFPTDLRPQSHEIIRSWAFYSIVKSHLHQDSVPWKRIMISGWCLAKDKTKMSKSKGNSLSPQHILDNFGTDVVRYWASTARLGADSVLSENTMKIGKKLTNKIWNAAKFVSPFIVAFDQEEVKSPLDLWMIQKACKFVDKVDSHLEELAYCEARECAEHFFWYYFCDNYLELVKKRSYSNHGSSARHTLSLVLKVALKLFAPFLPYVTDEIYMTLYPGNSIHASGSWPKLNFKNISQNIPGEQCFEVLRRVREYKSRNNLSIKHMIPGILVKSDNEIIKEMEEDIKSSCNVENIKWNIKKNAEFSVSFTIDS